MVITSQEQLTHLIDRLREETAYVYPVAVDAFIHNIQNHISSLHFRFDDGTFYTVSVNHPDAPHFEVDLSSAHKLVTLYKKELLHLTNAKNIVDLATLVHLNYDVIPLYREYYTMGIHHIKNQFKFKNLHYSIPLTSWVETAEAFLQHCLHLYQRYESTETTDAFTFINDTTIPTLTSIEKSGLCTTDGFVYSDYNIYTTTGRPSNAFGGINFAALNKNDGTREKFVSRFGENGTLVQFDYEAFHPRLAASLIKYPLPDTSFHTHLAQQYYGTEDITEEMYEESKARTFALMYGQTDDTGGVEFFQQLKKYSSELWELYRQNGFVLSESGRKVVVPDPNPSKVFNYLMQLTETEVALHRVESVCKLLMNGFNSKVILYTYDAILLDVHNDELDSMENVAEILNTGGYPIRQYRGSNYNNLILHKI